MVSAKRATEPPATEIGSDDAGLISRCQAGDRAALRVFYDLHARFVLHTARRLGTPPEEVEDVAQEVFGVAFSKLHTFRSGKVSSWLYRICANRVSEGHRRRGVRRAFASFFGGGAAHPVTPPTVERELEQREAEQRVGDILGRMAAKKREVFALFEIEGLSGDDIAERLGCRVDTVWTRLFYARKEFARLGRRQALVREGSRS